MFDSPTIAPLVVLSIVAPIGAIDALYFHIYKFRLYARRESQLETTTHVVRGLLIAAAVFLLARYEPRGGWYWVVTGLVIADFANTIADVLLEPKSRASLGGLPPLEYAIHVVAATGIGVVGAAWILGGWPLAQLPTELAPPPDMPGWLAFNRHALYVGAMLLALFEGALLVRAVLGRSRTVPEPA